MTMVAATHAFTKILIANRGEIACRIARTARAMGYRTVAVYSDADAKALHVTACDQAVRIGPAAVSDSYLSATALLDAARRSGADAVHPGYGFLSENAAFAAACAAAGLVFIGPPAAAIDAMGNKAAAKRRMIEAGVPCVPGYQGADQSDATLIKEARRIGFPVMVKAAAGGGGRGMRLVDHDNDLASALTAARSEAEHAFGLGELILEKAVVDARHVEIQVFGDCHGNVVHLGERDCSVQRRHQKVIEEAPSPAVDAALRARMGAAAVTAAKIIGYVGAGTVEFLLAADGTFYFLEMNTRLQVEHPVTELITGLDLVAWQLRVARGEPLPLTHEQICFQGHAIEVRLYAEDPAQQFLPQSGDIALWLPPAGDGVRVDHGLKRQDTVSPFYDPMIAKLIAHGSTRDEARRRLIQALERTTVLGLTTNAAFLRAMLENKVFAAGVATTSFIGQAFPAGSSGLMQPVADATTNAIAAALLLEASGEMPETALAGWSSTGVMSMPVLLACGVDKAVRVDATIEAALTMSVRSGDTVHRVVLGSASLDATRSVSVDGERRDVIAVVTSPITVHLSVDGHAYVFHDRLRAPREARAEAAGNELRAPMNGRVVRVNGKAGDDVRKGQCLVVLEAMKMQHEISASRDGVLVDVPVQEGQQVATRTLLAVLS
jgi:geranyl-CoA carboxylase alpha subunit